MKKFETPKGIYSALWAMKMPQFVKSSLASDLHECDNTSLKALTMNKLIGVFESLKIR